MARKNLPPSAFALPGLAKDSRKPFGLHNQRDGYSFSGTTNLPQKHGSNATDDQLDDSLSLVDDQGVFLAPQTSHTLEHLTKTRPRSPGRRSPSPFRKFDSSDNLSGHSDVLNNSLELENPEKWMRDDRDYKNDRIKSLDERSLSPTLILTNDVGLSVSSSALPKPSPIKRNLANHSEVFSTSDKLRSRENGEVNVSVEKQTSNAIRPGRGDIIPPPVPLHPPPQLEDDFVPHVNNKLLREEVEHSSQPSKTVVRMDRYDLPAKLDSTSTSSQRSNGAYRTDEFMRNKQSDSTSSDKRKYINNSLSRTANAQELGRTFSEDSDSGLTGLPRIGSGILDKQVSLDSGISSLPSQSVTPWRTSSRQRNPVEKSPSARRRRFKPVTLSDESELKDSDNPVGNHDTFNSTGTVSDHNSSARLRGTQFETSAFGPLHRGPEKRRENQDLGYGVHKSEFITDEKLRKVDNAVQEASQVMEISDRSALSSKAGSTVKNDRQSPVWSDVNDMSRTMNPESMVVFEYDDASNVKKVEENDSDEKFTSHSLDLRTPHTIESKEKKVMTNGTLDDTSTVSKSDVTQHRKSPITLPKVVIEYDGVVISDPIIDGYDAEDSSSDDKTSLLSYSSVNDQYVLSNRNMDQDSDASHSSDDGDYFNSNGTMLVDEEDMNLEEEDHTFVESAEEEIELEAPQGIEYLDQSEDGLMYQPARAITEVSHVHEADEMVFQPPPMFASFGEEGEEEEEDEEEQEDEVEENGYDIRSFSPAIPPLLLEEQPRDDRPFHNLALEAWTEEDCVEWLDFIGLAHFTEEFREHHVDGRMLKNVNFQLLEEIGIHSPDEREVILSEIYRRFHPEEEDMFEMEVQGALESASEQEKMKIMAVLNALRSPAFQAELGVASSTGSSSPRDSDAGFQVASETVSLSSSMTGSDDHPRDDAMPPPPPPPTWTQSVQKSEVNHSEWERSENQETISQEDERPRKTTKGKEKSIEKERKSGKHGHKHKKHKGVSKLLDSLSLGSGSSKLTKLFHSSASSKKLNPAMQYLLQAGPQGLVRIWPMALSQETNYCSFLVSMTTTCSEVVKLVFEKYDVVEDARRFYICEVHLGKGGAHHDLTDVDCPLLYQCRWSDPEKYRFELRSRDEGVIKMLFELEEYDDDLDYRSMALSMKTPCSEALSLIVKKFSLPGDTRDYYLVEVSEENEDDREEVADHVYPLRLQRAWSAPDHVFRLCRRVTVVKDDSKQDGWIVPEATEDISQEPSNYLQSESSSVRDEDELDSAADMDGVEEDEVVEDTTQELMEGFRELDSEDQSAVDETERAAIEELRIAKRELLSKDVELQELRLKSSALLEKEREIESLKRENEALRRGGEEFGELAAISKKVAESERGFERVQVENEELRKATSELEEKSIHEISMRDREIERLYFRNNELCSKEKELESLRKKSEGFDTQGEELAKLRLLQHESSSSRTELVTKLDELQTRHDEMLVDVGHVEELKRINRELCKKVDEGEIVRQELERSEADRRELKRKLEELERKRKEFEEVYNGVESLRSENRQLSAQSKDAEEMKKNIIKLSAQLRDMERHDEVAYLQKKLEQSDAEKHQLSEKVAELQKREGTARENTKKVEDLKLENIFLVERTKEVDELKTTVAKLTGEVRENESFRQKYKELRDVESYLTKQTSTLENVVRQKDQRLKESEKKVKSLTESVKDMEAKLEEQEQNRTYLDQLLSMLKDRDPALLHLMNTSLASSEPEEWC